MINFLYHCEVNSQYFVATLPFLLIKQSADNYRRFHFLYKQQMFNYFNCRCCTLEQDGHAEHTSVCEHVQRSY